MIIYYVYPCTRLCTFCADAPLRCAFGRPPGHGGGVFSGCPLFRGILHSKTLLGAWILSAVRNLEMSAVRNLEMSASRMLHRDGYAFSVMK